MRVASLLAAYYFWTFSLIRGALVNITVDDTVPNPDTDERLNYTSIWQVGQTCTGCARQPNAARAYLGSWHGATNVTSLESVAAAFFSFNGSALYVYGILNNNFEYAVNLLKFFVDGELQGSYDPNDTDYAGSGFKYNVLLFSVDSLSLRPHTFKLNNIVGPDGSVVFLDYVVYTTDESRLSSSPQASNRPPDSTMQPGISQSPGIPSASTTPDLDVPTRDNNRRALTGNNIAAFVISICTGSLVGIYLIWRALVFFRRRKATVQSCKLRDPAWTIASTSSLRTSSRTTEHNSSTDGDTTLVSNVCVVQLDTDVESRGSRGAVSGLARRTEKWRAFIYGSARSSV